MTLVQCAACHGAGEWEVRIGWWGGPIEPCGWCNGTGRTSRQMNMFLARWAKDPNWGGPSEKALAAHYAAMKEAK